MIPLKKRNKKEKKKPEKYRTFTLAVSPAH